MGCEERVKRKDLVRHMEEGAQKHVRLMTRNYLEMVKDQTELKQSMMGLQEETKSLTADLAQTKGKLADTELRVFDLKRQLEMIKLHTHHVISISKITVDFDALKRNDQKCWENKDTFCTFPSNCVLKINLYPRNYHSKLYIELTHVPSDADRSLLWPMGFTMTTRLLNQNNDYVNYETTEKVYVNRGGYSRKDYISYSTIEEPPQGARYTFSRRWSTHIELEVLVTEL